MRVRRWIKRVAACSMSACALICVAYWVLPQPWWMKEAGPSPSPFSFVRSFGTGFFVTPDGWLLTNAHVTAGCRRVSIGNGKLTGLVADRVLYPTDTQLDLAAVHIARHAPAFLRFTVMKWPSQTSDLKLPSTELAEDVRSIYLLNGPAVSVIGFPGYDHDASPVSFGGELSGATSSDQRHWFLTVKAPVRSGSSGSPVINARSEVVGIVFKGSITLPKDSSAALVAKTLKTLPTSASQGILIPAAIAQAFVHAVDPSYGSEREKSSTDPNATVVRVFCFR